MLSRLRIADLALIEDLEIDLGPGLNVLTGETGAGKSVIVESIGLLAGGRASASVVRDGADHATVEGLFSDGAGEEWVVRREVWRDRTNRCYLDGAMATARSLRERADGQVAIHGQHEDQRLLERGAQREILDAFAGATTLAERVAEAVGVLEALRRERSGIEARGAERETRSRYLRSQVEEIEAAELEPGEEETLAADARLLGHSAERARLAAETHAALETGDAPVGEVLAAVVRSLDRLAELDPEMAPAARRANDARYEIEDLARDLDRYARAVDHDPERLGRIEARRDLIFRLRRKHGRTVEEILDLSESMAAEIRELEREAARERSLDGEIGTARKELETAAVALADAREAGADRLEEAVRGRLAELGMGEGIFRVRLERAPDPAGVEYDGEPRACGRGGLERVVFLIAPNPGEALRPLAEIASGGELSRTLLALEAALAEADRTPTLIFDEVDSGIGGAAAHLVARQLADVARHHQVVVVTHLAAIAAVADRHLVAVKGLRDGRSVTEVRAVEGEERVREVSRLLGGDPERDVSRHHAEEMLGGIR
ncbi:MAG TPA: DNA repair protein RecN [Gemmatimonadota bacterium]|nr:DNA repair protein RecN [Gemmatimonadota bacterium]